MNRPTLPMTSKNILLVEEDQLIRQNISRILQIENYTILQAADGNQALKILARFKPDLIISDINLPEMDGIQFYRKIRENRIWVTIPFIFLTGEDAFDNIRMVRELGAEDYLIKPIVAEDLIRTIHGKLLRAAELEVAHMGQAYLETVTVLANAVEGRDNYTRGHVDRVATYALKLAQELNWPPDHMRVLELGARLHDIGKVRVPDHILNKSGPLTDEEWAVMKTHPAIGAKIVRGVSHLMPALPYILYHHERWDGGGYPEGLKGREIPIEARLLTIVDSFDAVTTKRPYHPGKSLHEVVNIIMSEAGKQFDPDLVPIFIAVIGKLGVQ